MTKIPISLYAEATPNPKVMKFTANKMLVDNNIYEFLNRAEAISSPLALELFGFPFVESVFISGNFVSVTKKQNDIEWSDIVLEMREFIRDFIADGGKVINEDAPIKLNKESVKHKEELKREFSDIEKKIADLLDEYVRPAVEQDGGFISLKKFEKGVVTVSLQELIFLFLFSSLVTQAQNGLLFGLQLKPIVPNSYFNASGISQDFYSDDSELYSFNLKSRIGQSLGMIVRQNITSFVSLESGINFNQRRYKLQVKSAPTTDFSNFSVRTYEVPLQFLAYVRVSNKWFLNGSFGVSYNIFTSNVYSEGEQNPFFYQNTIRRKKGQSAFIANLGTEYRTSTNGYYYFGISLHRPLKSIVRVFPEYNDGTNEYNISAPSTNSDFLELNGNFLTVDFRYFFKNSK